MVTHIPKKKYFLIGVVAIGVLLIPTAQSDITYPEEESSIYITDLVGALNAQEKQDINMACDDLDYDMGTVLAVAILNSTDDFTSGNDTNMSLNEYTTLLFDEWQVGDQEWKDGLLIVLAVNQSGEGYDWAYTGGDFWQEYSDVLERWESKLPNSIFNDLNDSNWAEALEPMVDLLAEDVREFWYQNPYIEPEPGDWMSPPILEGSPEVEGGESALGEVLLSMVCCLGVPGVVVAMIVMFRGNSSTRSNQHVHYNGNQNGWNQNNGYHPGNQGGYQQNNYYMGDNSPPQSNNPSTRSKSTSSSRSGGSSRSSGSSSRSSGGSSRSRGGSSRSRGGRGGGGRRGR